MDKRKMIWRHNSFLRHVAMIKKHMPVIMQSPTTTEESKRLAAQILNLSHELYDSLRSRTDA